jgi:hypothetical protein
VTQNSMEPAEMEGPRSWEMDQPGAPTRDDLAADTNLYPPGSPDTVPDGTQPADLEAAPVVEEGDAGPLPDPTPEAS